MGKLIIGSFEEFEQYLGQDLGLSNWLTIDQEQVAMFADATHDHQWIPYIIYCTLFMAADRGNSQSKDDDQLWH